MPEKHPITETGAPLHVPSHKLDGNDVAVPVSPVPPSLNVPTYLEALDEEPAAHTGGLHVLDAESHVSPV